MILITKKDTDFKRLLNLLQKVNVLCLLLLWCEHSYGVEYLIHSTPVKIQNEHMIPDGPAFFTYSTESRLSDLVGAFRTAQAMNRHKWDRGQFAKIQYKMTKDFTSRVDLGSSWEDAYDKAVEENTEYFTEKWGEVGQPEDLHEQLLDFIDYLKNQNGSFEAFYGPDREWGMNEVVVNEPENFLILDKVEMWEVVRSSERDQFIVRFNGKNKYRLIYGCY